MDKLEPCQVGYQCVYLKRVSQTQGVCHLGKCVIHHIQHPDDTEEFAYDELRDRFTPWTTKEHTVKHEVDPLEDWYDGWREKNGFGTYKTMMESADTYSTKTGGKIVQKRQAKTR